MTDIEDLPNLGPISAGWLREVGLFSVEELRLAGPVAAFLSVRIHQLRASLNLLWALDAGLCGIHWTKLTPLRKEKLKSDLSRLSEIGDSS